MSRLRQAAERALAAIEGGESFDVLERTVAPDLRAALAETPLTVDALRTEFERRFRGAVAATRIESGPYLSPAIELEWRRYLRRYLYPPTDPCLWTAQDDDTGAWASACGELWSFIDGGPDENRVRYCHGCGRSVAHYPQTHNEGSEP